MISLIKNASTRNERIINLLGQQLDALSEHVAEQLTAGRRGERNRMALLYLHAGFGLFTAPLFLSWALSPAGLAGTSWAVIRDIPAIEWILFGLLFVGGTVLAIGLAMRVLTAVVVGLGLVAAWYAVLALSFAAATIAWIADGAPNNAWTAVYAPLVYAHLSAIMGVHLRTVVKIVRKLGR